MKEQVLAALKAAGDYVSGEEISRGLQKSRAAVWQWIEELRRDGYEIEASPRKGYRLLRSPDRLFPWEVAPYLTTAFVGRRIEYRPSVDSTNELARSLARQGAAEGLVVVAEEQTAGRGRRGRAWRSPWGKGVWSTTLLRPAVSPYEAPKMALVAALATAQAIEEATGLAATVKWPNDVLVAGRKVCGILVEMEAELELVRFLAVGIGVNANLTPEEIPPEARQYAGSLMTALGRPVDRRALCGALLNRLEAEYLRWQREGFNAVLVDLRRRTEMLGRPVRVFDGDGAWDGVARDIAADGALLVEAEGRVRPVYAAEVSVRPTT